MRFSRRFKTINFIVLLSIMTVGNSYASAETSCPPQNSHLEIIKRLDLNIDAESFITKSESGTCDSLALDQVLKTFTQLHQLKFAELPEKWNNRSTRKLMSPWQFFNKTNVKITYTQRLGMAAFYVYKQNLMVITQNFFKSNVVEQMGILIHERAHALAEVKDHTKCRHGQLQFVHGACDNFLSERSAVTSYGMHYWFFKLYANLSLNTSHDNKMLALIAAEQIIGHRVNFPKTEMSYNDVLTVSLEKDGIVTVAVIDPITQNLIPMTGLRDKVLNISEDKKTSGTLLKLNNGEYLGLSTNQLLSPETTKAFSFDTDITISSVKAIFHPDLLSSRYALLDQDNHMHIEQLDRKQGTLKYQPNKSLKQQVRHVFSLSEYFNVGLTVDDIVHVYDFSFNSLGSDRYNLFRSISPSYFGGSILGVNSLGEAMNVDLIIEPMSQGFQSLDINSAHDNINDALMFKEGSSIQVILKQDDSLYIHSLDFENTNNEIKIGSKVNNIVINQAIFVDSDLYKNSPESQKFSAQCQVKKVKTEPWLKRPIGINNKNELVVLTNDECVLVSSKVKNFHFDQSDPEKSQHGFSSSLLVIEKTDQSKKVVKAYLDKAD